MSTSSTHEIRLVPRLKGLPSPDNFTTALTDLRPLQDAREAYDPVYGARPLKRFLQRQVETPLSRKLIAGQITDGDHVTVTLQAGELVFGPTGLKKAA